MALKVPGDGDARIREYGELLDENEAYDEAGADWGVGFDGDFLFVVELDDVYDGEAVYFFLGLEDGDYTAAYGVSESDDGEYGFVFRGSYIDWKRLFEGESGPTARSRTASTA